MSTSGSKQIHEALIGTVMAVGEDVEVLHVGAVQPQQSQLAFVKQLAGRCWQSLAGMPSVQALLP